MTSESGTLASVLFRDESGVVTSTCGSRRDPTTAVRLTPPRAWGRTGETTASAVEPLPSPTPRRIPAAGPPGSSRRQPAGAPRPRVQAAGRRHDLAALTVLLVEDDPDALRITRIMLEHHGAQVVTATDGVDALWRLIDAHPDVAVVDLRMPLMDGFALAARLRADPHWWNLPIVALTALGTEADFVRTLEQDFQAHLVKPVDDDTLATVVLRATRGRRRAS